MTRSLSVPLSVLGALLVVGRIAAQEPPNDRAAGPAAGAANDQAAGPAAGAAEATAPSEVMPLHFSPGVGGDSWPQGGLLLEQVVASARAHHPRVLAALQSEDIARAELLSARGGFDPQLDVSTKLRSGGYYELRRLDAELKQPTSIWGTEFYTGYRLGRGIEDDRYPTYYGDETLDRGEVRLGVRVPIWRDGPLDKRRAARAEADLGVDAAAAQRHAVEVDLQQAATDAYFGWIAAGRRAQVSQQLLELADARRTFVNARVAAGAVADVESLEVERSVLKRRASLLAAKRGVERNALVLSLYHRAADGSPSVPGYGALPERLAVPERLPTAGSDRTALDCVPAVAQLRAKIAQARVKAELARAQRAPRLDAQLQASRDMGDGSQTLPGTVFEGGVVFSMPLLMRTPRGQVQAAEGAVQRLEQDLRFLQDKLLTAQQDALSAERYAWERYEVATDLLSTVERLAVAERVRFEAGSTSLFIVNLREQALAEAALDQVDAVRELWAARAAYRAATFCGDPSP